MIKVILKNGITGTVENKDLSVRFDKYDTGYTHTIPQEDIIAIELIKEEN